MPRKANLLNVRDHLKHLQEVIELYRKYGDCPLFKEELARLSVINKAILRKHEAKQTRHDVYVNAERKGETT